MRKLFLKLIPIIMLVSLTSIGFALWVITPPIIGSSNKGNALVDDVTELEVLTSSCDMTGLKYNKKGFFTKYIYSEDLNGYDTITYDNFNYYVDVDLEKLKEYVTVDKVELKIELSSKYINFATYKNLIEITSTTGHTLSDLIIVDGSICVYITFNIKGNVNNEKVGINFDFGKIDTKPVIGTEEPEEDFFITLANLGEDKTPFVVLASIYTKKE